MEQSIHFGVRGHANSRPALRVLRVGKLGTSSVRYEIGLFEAGEAMSAACGHFVHVYVDTDQRGTVPVPLEIQKALEKLV